MAVVRAFMADARDEPFGLVLEGAAGIGKSTLWDTAVAEWRAAGGRVLSSRPAETEQGLALVGLGDLFEDALADVLPALSPPRRRALEVAFLVEEAGEEGADPRALATATRSALELLSGAQPLLLAIDDVQWFDDSSTRALAFAVRRR